MTIQLLNHSTKSEFTDVFNICIASTAQLKDEVFRLRYQVYCEELGYECLSKFSDGMEKDIYDSRSIHCLIKHSASGRSIACVRLVLSESNNLNAKFPLENIYQNSLIDFENIPRSQFAEISRLIIVSNFRNWSHKNRITHNLHEFNHNPQQISFPLVTLGLYLSFVSTLAELNINYGLALMEPKLARHLRIVGIDSYPLSESIEFNGKRKAFLLNTEEIINNFEQKPRINHLFQTIQARIRDNISYNYHTA